MAFPYLQPDQGPQSRGWSLPPGNAARLSAMSGNSNAGPGYYRPSSPRDSARDARLANVMAGADERFGTGAGGSEGLPYSAFNRRTVQTDPGRYTVHPMIPSYGGPMPQPVLPLGTTAADRASGEMGWMNRHLSQSGSAYGAQREDGSMYVQGNKAGPGQPGWSYAPAAQSAAMFNRIAASNPGLNLGELRLGRDGAPVGDDGSPLDDAAMARKMIQARTGVQQQKNMSMREAMRMRLATRAMQRRGDMGPLAGIAMQKMGAGMFGGQMPGQMPQQAQALFGMAGQMLDDSGFTTAQRAKFRARMATALSQPNGHQMLPAIIDEMGQAATAAARLEQSRKSATRDPSPGGFDGAVDSAAQWFNDAFGITAGNQRAVRGGQPVQDPTMPALGAMMGIPQNVGGMLGSFFGGARPAPGTLQRGSSALNRWNFNGQ